ncbi:phage repressor protein CI [Providencia sp. CIM-Carb-044]|uniref:phage repressor protein CI n=1 Tax=Providencia sp. CIM-Carb-044 TaxID=3096048 RepID=UPI0024AC0F5B|nr:phage repressor protein CI [Providencia sp. CIM-Carb-044]MCK9791368.1 helix-turn-helix domain-containing protein [Providencia rettgeri]MDX7422038.1 phage repressor protein CI [Providencia sp. CIM-Carb-044]
MNDSFDFVSCENSGVVLDRIMEAYGFTSKMTLAEHFNMGASAISGRYKRNIFPADMVVRCMHETGANLEWLVWGTGNPFDNERVDILKLTNFKELNGELQRASTVMFDKAMFSANKPMPIEPICVQIDRDYYLVDKSFGNIFDGKWLVDIEGKISVRELTRIPIQRVRVSGVGMAFDCDLKDLTILGRVIKEIKDY